MVRIGKRWRNLHNYSQSHAILLLLLRRRAVHSVPSTSQWLGRQFLISEVEYQTLCQFTCYITLVCLATMRLLFHRLKTKRVFRKDIRLSFINSAVSFFPPVPSGLLHTNKIRNLKQTPLLLRDNTPTFFMDNPVRAAIALAVAVAVWVTYLKRKYSDEPTKHSKKYERERKHRRHRGHHH